MLVLLSFALVLVATVLLVLGLLADEGLALIYLSIGCSVVAGVLLVVATRVGRPKAAPAAAVDTTPEPTAAPVPAPAPVVEDAAFAPEVVPVAAEVVPAEDDFFPIADYDELSVPQILPLLPELYVDELDVVEERERSSKARVEVLTRLGELRVALADAPADATGATVLTVADEAPAMAEKAAAAKKKVAAKKVPAKKAAAVKKAAAPVKKAAAPVKKAAAPVKKAAAPVKKAAAPVKKATKATKKAPAPVKKATKATKATKKA